MSMGLSATSAALLAGGMALSAGGSIAGAAMSAGGRKNPPKFNSKGAGKTINKYVDNVNRIASSIDAPEVDWVAAAGKALGFNEENLSRFQNMARSLSLSGTRTILDQIRMADPAFFSKREQADKNNLALMRGEVPMDIQQSLARTAAFTGLASGTGGGSGINRNLRARDLGTTSLNLAQTGDQSAQRWTALLNDIITRPAFVSPLQTTQFSGISSGQAIQSAFRQGEMDFRANLAQADLRAGAQDTALRSRLGIAGQQYQSDLNQYAARASTADTWGNAISSSLGNVGGALSGLTLLNNSFQSPSGGTIPGTSLLMLPPQGGTNWGNIGLGGRV